MVSSGFGFHRGSNDSEALSSIRSQPPSMCLLLSNEGLVR